MKPKSQADYQAVFDALDVYMQGTGFVSSSATVTLDGSGVTHTMSSRDGQTNMNSISYTERTAGVRVNVQPISASLGPGQTQQFTAAATNPDGSPVAGATFAWLLAAGALGTVDANGLYTAPAALAANATDLLTCKLPTGESWSSVSVGLVAAARHA